MLSKTLMNFINKWFPKKHTIRQLLIIINKNKIKEVFQKIQIIKNRMIQIKRNQNGEKSVRNLFRRSE